MRFQNTWGAVLCLAAMCSGCGGLTDLASVRGKITLDGQPLDDAMVVFSPTSAGTTAYGRTNSEGEYEMMFSDSEKGAWLGENLVRISTGDVGTGDSPATKERVPAVYNVQTTLRANVEKKSNVFDFALESKVGKIIQTIQE